MYDGGSSATPTWRAPLWRDCAACGWRTYPLATEPLGWVPAERCGRCGGSLFQKAFHKAPRPVNPRPL